MIKIGNLADHISVYTCQPKNKEELKEIIKERISKEGIKCDLNDIDVSLIDEMYGLFMDSKFNGDISKWNVSNVENARMMFTYSKFNGDISKWDVSKIKDMSFMFYEFKFNKDISSWNINEHCNTENMFLNCLIEKKHKPELP